MFALSFVCHLAVFLIIAKSQQLREFRPEETPVTYVDMVTLPVASPQQGTPAPAAEPAAPAPPAPQAAPPAAMNLPQAKSPTKPQAKNGAEPQKNVKAPTPAQPAPADEGRAFNERMERLAEERRQAAVLDRLRQKNSGPVGMPGGHGNEAGSDYSSYLQSRLKDAFSQVMTSQSKSPQLIATITVGADGRIDYRVEQPSGDPLFDDSVARAVTIAGRTLKAPPGGGQFKRVFRFRPEGVGVR
jgi:colicin import membrane protein